MRQAFSAGTDDHDRRIETVARRLCPQLKLSAIHKALRQGDIRLNGAKIGPDARVHAGDEVAVWTALLPAASEISEAPPVPDGWVLWENEHWLVLNKPSGELVHRGEGSGHGYTLDERVRARVGTGSGLGFRPGPLHRLDRETSGVLVFSRSLIGARSFSEALAAHQVKKTYWAVLRGELTRPQTVDQSLSRDSDSRRSAVAESGAEAHTRFIPLASAGGLTLAEVELGTGRTHQIRAHAQASGFPLAGDTKYGGGGTPSGLDVAWLLHARRLDWSGFSVEAPLPPKRQNWLEQTFSFKI